MARILVTGSADGLGLLAAKELIRLQHQVVLHARNAARAEQAMQKAPGAENVLIADLSYIEEIKKLADTANAAGEFDAVIHNAGILQSNNKYAAFSTLLTVNTLAPYLLTCLMKKPERLIYLSSGMHLSGNADLLKRGENVSYSDTKLHNVLLTKAVARKWKNVYANAVNPGWVPTKMGGPGAPDSLQKGYETQVWLATSGDEEALVSGYYFHHKKQSRYHPAADDLPVLDAFIKTCEQLTGVQFH